MFRKSQILATNLERANINLEKTVQDRTNKIRIQNKALISQKEALEQKNEEIEVQKDNLVKQNEVVSEQKQQITSSIMYASRIQDALFDQTTEKDKVAPDSFIFFKPKDIVSGDFYWFRELKFKDKYYKIFSVIDCTGHGVPGAFMSLLGITFLNEIVNSFNGPFLASHILDKMRDEIKDKLQRKDSTKAVKDGMDMALCMLDYDAMKLHYSGAYNPLYIVRHKENIADKTLEIIKGDRMPIGAHFNKEERFSNHTIPVQKDDLIYIFSDGFIDQFGGKENKKFNTKQFNELILACSKLDISEQEAFIRKTLKEWMGIDYPQIDDITIVGVRV